MVIEQTGNKIESEPEFIASQLSLLFEQYSTDYD